MQDALKRERGKAQEILGGQRAASARRISALSEELKEARRQLDLERNHRTNVRAPKGRGGTHGSAGRGVGGVCSHTIRSRFYLLGFGNSFALEHPNS